MSNLTKKVALVTGGSRGIGAAIAKRLAADGASVAITYAKDANAASAVVKVIEGDGGKAVAIQADAADVEAVKGAVEKTVATFGRLDVLVNNAGTAIPKGFEETTMEEMDRVIDINVRGTLVATQAALKHMKNGGRSSWPTQPQLSTKLPATTLGLLAYSGILQNGGGDVPDLRECQLPLQRPSSGNPPPSLTLAGNFTRFHACFRKTHLSSPMAGQAR
jgi:NAD(P)-dependent dehydrogenase (short-subunit alcohol dehydrogenase family)